MQDIKCPFCEVSINPNSYIRSGTKRETYFECERCGNFSISDKALTKISNTNLKSIFSYWVCKNQKEENHPHLNSELVNKILKEVSLPDIDEQVNELIKYIGNNSSYGKSISIMLNTIVASIGSQDIESLLFVFDELNRIDFIKVLDPQVAKDSLMNRQVRILKCQLTIPGWDRYKELKSQQTSIKEYNFQKYVLTYDEKVWLNELLKQNFNKVDLKKTKVKVWGKVSKNFDPSKIDYRLARDNRLTLVGLWHIDPENKLFNYSKRVIYEVKSQILKNQKSKIINSGSLSQSLKIGLREVQITLTLLNDLGFFSGGSHQSDVIIFNEVHFYQDHTGYDMFLSYTSFEESIEQFYNRDIGQEVGSSIPSQTKLQKPKTKSKLNQEVWKQIAEEYGIDQKVFGKKIKFVDKNTKKIIFRDIEDAYVLSKKGFSKPSIILAGGVIEELLRIYLFKKGHEFKKNNFSEYVNLCETNNYLRIGARRLTDSSRDFRNLVHLESEIKTKTTPSQPMASNVVSAIFTIVNDF